MRTETLSIYSDKTIKVGLVIFAAVYPLTFSPFNHSIYSLAKYTLLSVWLLIMVGAWATKIILEQKITFTNYPLNLPVFTLLFLATISTLVSINTRISLSGQFDRFQGLYALFGYALVYFLASQFAHKKQLHHNIITGFLLSSVLVATYGILQHFGIDFLPPNPQAIEVGRSFSTLGNPNFLGAYLIMVIAIALSQLLSTRQSLKWLPQAALLLGLLCLIYTFSRASWLGLVGVLGFYIIFFAKRLWSNKKALINLAAISLILVISYTLLGKIKLTKAPYSLAERTTSTVQFKSGTIKSRLATWSVSMKMAQERPILGFGPDTYRYVFWTYKPITWHQEVKERGIPDRAHNRLIQIGVTQGILSLAVYLWIIITFFSLGIFSLKKHQNPESQVLLGGLLAACLGYFIQVQFQFAGFETTPLVWLFIGLSIPLASYKPRLFKLSLGKKEFSSLTKYVTILVLVCALLWLSSIQLKKFLADRYFALGRKNHKTSAYDQAIDQYEKAVNLNPDESIYWLFLGHAYEDKVKATSDKFWADVAIEKYLAAITTNPLEIDNYNSLAEFYLFYGENTHDFKWYEKAEDQLRNALIRAPTSVRAHYNLGRTYYDQNLLDQAMLEWKKTIAIDPNLPQPYYQLGQAYQRKRKLYEAKKAYRKALIIDPDYQKAKQALAKLE